MLVYSLRTTTCPMWFYHERIVDSCSEFHYSIRWSTSWQRLTFSYDISALLYLVCSWLDPVAWIRYFAKASRLFRMTSSNWVAWLRRYAGTLCIQNSAQSALLPGKCYKPLWLGSLNGYEIWRRENYLGASSNSCLWSMPFLVGNEWMFYEPKTVKILTPWPLVRTWRCWRWACAFQRQLYP
jgi:hypothetical protein